MGQTVLKLMDNVGQQINGFLRTPYGEVTNNVGVQDLTLDGNRANNTATVNAFFVGAAPGSTLEVTDVMVNRVEARNFNGYGFDPHERTVRLTIENSVAHHNALDGFVADFQTDGVFRNNQSYSNDRHGFNIVTSTSNFLLDNNNAYNNGGTGITIQRGSDPAYAWTNHVTVQGGEVYGNGSVGIELKLVDDIQVLGVNIHDNQKEGIKVSGGTDVTIRNNNIHDNGLGSSSGFYDAVNIVDQFDTFSGTNFTPARVIVENNTIASTNAIRPAYGIAEESPQTGVLTSFTGNTINGMKNGDVIKDGQVYDESGTPIGGGSGNYDVKLYGAKGDGVDRRHRGDPGRDQCRPCGRRRRGHHAGRHLPGQRHQRQERRRHPSARQRHPAGRGDGADDHQGDRQQSLGHHRRGAHAIQ